ncbi:MAG: hypothetical protein NE328_11035 [Lentisphaeraceae bacterium]|nr:hypothetical protein [Lentisphaeraceae bacterium]
MNIDFNTPPPVGQSYRRLVFSRKKGVPVNGVLPDLCLTLKNCTADENLLKKYNSLCNFKSSDFLPITFPYVLAGPLHLALMANKDFPLKGAGLLHLRNRIKYFEKIKLSDSFDIVVKTADSRFRPQGYEFDIITTVEKGGQILWECKSTFLSRGKFAKENPASEDENIFVKMEINDPLLSFHVPGNAGRAYAKVCKDYNPIHIATPLAWLFGFKKSIAHGMWVSARALGELESIEDISEFDLAFKGPVYTGSVVIVQKEDEHFNLFATGNKRPVILGRIV